MQLSSQEQLRYSRHLLLDKIGEAGQLKLKKSHVVIVGCGGLGCPAALYLAASGVGELTLIDADNIELSNLQRQILYKTNHLKRSKVQTAANQLQALNPEIKLNTIENTVENADFSALINTADIVLDCTDNAASRYFINRACWQQQVALVSGAAIRGEGQLMVFNFSEQSSPCYQCVYPDLSEENLNCSNAGVVSPVLGIIGSMQALEAIKLLVDKKSSQQNKLLCFDAWQMSFHQFNLIADEHCKICGKNE
ncbi:HesA/MoeB/ThiF family protein [Catenovulum sp. 2E275]|uniref:HesA/MoeB/ThiF family protein n=1 Tax=Catenovulum sp. 2E275 TaxID=2980497 RepID=UPI0021D3631E|nr:HesA/MoeB/ThiF family protein [Catenovulum sp. 2E275]MCU4674996.1 HesA/MoeB/ThiF family protein [Catenovulum sp. 2E275]